MPDYPRVTRHIKTPQQLRAWRANDWKPLGWRGRTLGYIEDGKTLRFVKARDEDRGQFTARKDFVWY